MSEQAEQQREELLQSVEESGFDSLLKQKFRPKSEREQSNVEVAVNTFAEHVLAETGIISDDLIESIDSIIAELDSKLSDQINEVMHNEEFQELEGTWRGLHHLATSSETGEKLQIKTIDINKKELSKSLKRYKGTAFDQSPLFKKIYEQEYGVLGGHPFGCLVGDYFFDNSSVDVDLLENISNIAAASHAPFIAAASPSTLQLDDWEQMSDITDISSKFRTPEYAKWNSLRDASNSLYIGLTMPRFLSREPYSSKDNPVDEFEFEEDIAGPDSSQYTWSNSAYAMAANINRAFTDYGWCTQIRGVESGGLIEGLPSHTYVTEGGSMEMKCPTEVAISDRREAELAKSGLIPLVHRKNTANAVFMGAQSFNRPTTYDDEDATANANLSARLPYLFASSRFAHYLKCIVRDKVGSFSSRDEMESWLTNWVLQYVDGDPENSSEETKAKKPLANAEVIVQDVPGNPGYYEAQFNLAPHYQLEGVKVTLSLVSKLPSE